ncbi:NAD(P)-dependent dehydrogenase (short-subunit alcohol dehydrogenase family) [Arenibacter algicola]|uniref:Beta-ketoacyl-ACP reductase n=1 Tax=Arenibacter algicola TaxID=616991 RepID=A0A221UW43_9FLAO|nr:MULTISPECIES: SDR family oxidoreductase [Arenibacter]ASO05542.1 beta-ketoacyl-ACP reductase [Arenibacter algicola]MDX1759681.1 SDR family oxidoreductase [Arenibacter algicola]GBF21283.1 putative oxidoreductase [Arenibacter sp. NBRC 103722]HCO83256.1 KR domain-containing protein [Arenibacter sp.]|tara:strand:+ start:17431 stop:18249 length:819 start_codon:yes stop_codon:yes gene_type:complete
MSKLFSIENKIYALSGATGTLGGSIAKYLVENGAKVLLLGRSLDKLEEKCKELDAIAPNSAHLFVLDVMDEKQLTELKNTITTKFKRLDGLVNLAGGNIPGATLKPDQTIYDIELADTQKVVDINLFGTVIPTIVLSEIMAKQGFGSIVNISSMAAKQTISRVLGYSMAKAGVDIFTKWMANELASKFSDKIRVNAIAPGFFIGNQNRRLLTNEDGSFTDRGEKIITNTPMGRFGDASELNGMVHYLLSDASSFVTGTIYDIDGGFSSFSGV